MNCPYCERLLVLDFHSRWRWTCHKCGVERGMGGEYWTYIFVNGVGGSRVPRGTLIVVNERAET